MKMYFWLVTTDHLSDRLWFRDEEDFKMAMNIVAILAATLNVRIISFVLMSNHVHFVLECEEGDAWLFITKLKKRYSQYYWRKYGAKSFLEGNGIDIRPVSFDDESLERAIAYVQMNPVAANICLNPEGYPWGSGNAFFNQSPRKGVPFGSVSGREAERIIHCREKLPQDYLISDLGYIDAASYVQIGLVESLFRTPARMNYFLRSSSKAKRLNEGVSFTDQIISGAVKNLIATLFHMDSFPELVEVQQAETVRQIKYRFSCDPAQMARVLGISYDEVCRLLELM